MSLRTYNIFPRIYIKLFVIFSVLVGIAVNVLLVRTVFQYKSSAANYPVEIYLDPTEAQMPPDTTFYLMANPFGQPISFLSTRVYFDTSRLQLNADPNTSNSALVATIPPTSMSEANSTGLIDLVFNQKDGSPPPTSSFEIVRLNFRYIGATTASSSDITIVDERTQVVDSSSNDLAFDVKYATITPQSEPPLGSVGKVTFAITSLLKGSCTSELYIDTAIGCIPYSDTQALTSFFLSWGLGIAGGIAFILIVYASYRIITSQGDPKALQAGKELLVGAITGLIMLIFSAFILRFIGVDLLGVL